MKDANNEQSLSPLCDRLRHPPPTPRWPIGTAQV
jgi:hypothetical protein